MERKTNSRGLGGVASLSQFPGRNRVYEVEASGENLPKWPGCPGKGDRIRPACTKMTRTKTDKERPGGRIGPPGLSQPRPAAP